MNTAAKSAVIAFVVAGTLLCPTDLSSCGPFFRLALFSFPHQPGRPIVGTSPLGIVKPGFRRLYLYSAYRQLTTPLTPEESRALSNSGPKEGAPPATEEWLAARAKIQGLAKAPNIEVTVTRSTPTAYFQYTNCLDDAFHSAAATLNSRVAKKWNSDLVKDWVSAQDMVFSNCLEVRAPLIPPPATDPQLKADRAYQIAAAYFYASKLDEAETRFRQIAADRSSPWSDMSDYLIARVQIRRGTLENDPGAMKMADAQLQAILADASRKAMQAQARELLPFVRARLNPAGRLTELGQLLTKPDSRLSRDLTDYRFLYDKLESNLPPTKDELTDWLFTFHNKEAEHAVATWRAKHSLPWLLAAIVPLQPGGAPDVIQAADQVRPDSPAYLTASFHSIRLQIDSNPEQARTRLDGILKEDAKLDLSDRNSFYAERMKVAANFAEFLKYAQRVPAGVSWDEGAEVPPDTDPDSPLKNFKQGRTTLDADGAYVFNQRLPLRLMAEAAADKGVSPALRSNIAMAAWTRTVLLGDEAIALQVAPLAPATRTYAAETDKDRRLFAAVLLMLNNPGLHPYADVGLGRETELNKIDDYRDNWWCSFGAKKEDQLYADFYKDRSELRELIELYPKAPPAAKFLPAADQAAGDAEWKKLASMPAAPTYLSAAVVSYAQAHLEDPRVPEALALAVRSTRFGCTDAGTGKVSKQAYDLLHGKFPKSDAAARTKFWYK